MRNRFLNVTKLTLVLILSIFLLIFVGLGEARRTYPQFEVERLASQGELVQNGMNNFLLADLPLEQFPGFTNLTQPILSSDNSIYSFYVTDLTGSIVFSNVASQWDESGIRIDSNTQFDASVFQTEGSRYHVVENATLYQVTFDLENRFDTVGHLHVTMPKAVIDNTINTAFQIVFLAAIGLVVIFAFFIFLMSKYWMKENDTGWQKGGVRFLGLSYGVAFFILAIFVTATLLNIYVDGITGKIEGLGNSLAYRLNAALNLGLNIDDFRGLDEVMADYQRLNPDLSFVALTIGDEIVIHTDDEQVGMQWMGHPDHFEYRVPLSGEAGTLEEGLEIRLGMGIERDVIYRRLWRSAKNFLALFVAAAFLTSLFFNLIRSQSNQPKLEKGKLHNQRGYLLSLVGPIYFLIVFVTSGLTASFLPQYFQELATEANARIDISTLFSIYYTTYAIALLVATRLAENRENKFMLLSGATLVLISLVLLVFTNNYYVLFLVMAITGFGEGWFFIAVQSFILKVAAAHHRTRGAAIVVNSLYGGLLSGTAIGALLASDPTIGKKGVFFLGGLIVTFILIYILQLIPRIAGEDFSKQREVPADESEISIFDTASMDVQSARKLRAEIAKRQSAAQTQKSSKSNFLSAFTDMEFLATAFLIGIPVKIILTGLFKATLPIVLAEQNYPTEDIGQIMMLYAGGVLLSSAFIPRIADKLGKTKLLLFTGAVGSGIGLVLMGLMGWDMFTQSGATYWATILLLTGIIILGLSHGFIQAPIITHVSKTATADRLGKSSATSLYRLFERVGNIGGPLLVGGLLVQVNYSASMVSWIGLGVCTMGSLFLFSRNRKSKE